MAHVDDLLLATWEEAEIFRYSQGGEFCRPSIGSSLKPCWAASLSHHTADSKG